MGKKKKINMIVTGLTMKELEKEARALDEAEKAGIDMPDPKPQCYLCKRQEGEKSILISENEKDQVSLAEINLMEILVDMGDGSTFKYLICQECELLLSEMARIEIANAEEEFSEETGEAA
ncbi:MAG: hypothetical protein NUV31_01610 [Dehalococcoidales bacterium]|nr:hypothetical protein [Dehalococcoidales bacterium]